MFKHERIIFRQIKHMISGHVIDQIKTCSEGQKRASCVKFVVGFFDLFIFFSIPECSY